MVTNTTSISVKEANRLLDACFADIQKETESQFFVQPLSSLSDAETEEQHALSEQAIGQLDEQIQGMEFKPSTYSTAVQLLGRRGMILDDVADATNARFMTGIACILIEREKLFQALLSDPLTNYVPQDPLFSAAEKAQIYDSDLPNGHFGLSLGEAVGDYLKNRKPSWREKTYHSRVIALGYFVDYAGAEKALSGIGAMEIRQFRNLLPKLRSNRGRARHLTFQERLTENASAAVTNKSASLYF